ncbi:hypothetical protein GCM10022211_25430 [Sphingomonas humi]|uniref:Uncharacterized protein n=1 Tax=Sphingomonas humi TaxID=335630 RepID=A0ABP7SCY5_9SPHN
MDIYSVMSRLAERRSLFCSEADFQHELAHELRLAKPDLQVRLEYPLGPDLRGAIDILLLGPDRFALELKYLCKGLTAQVGGEEITLRHQSAHDIRRYDVCKDIQRMERYSERTGYSAAVLVLTNDPAYWRVRRRSDTVDAAFDLAETRVLGGSLSWGAAAGAGTTRGRESSLQISGRYRLAWRDFSDVGGPAGCFRYLWLPVGPSSNPQAGSTAN